MKEIGILGTGRMAVRLAELFAQAGVEVLLGSRTPKRAMSIASQLKYTNIKGGSYDDALSKEWFLPALFLRDGLLDILLDKKDSLKGKVLLDISNPFNDKYDDFILDWDTSGSEEIQKNIPGLRIIGAFKNVWYEVFDEPIFDEGVSDVYVVSDSAELKKDLMDTLVNSDFRYIDAGSLKNARTVERMTLFATELSLRYKFFPRSNWKFLGEPWIQGEKDRYKEIIQR